MASIVLMLILDIISTRPDVFWAVCMLVFAASLTTGLLARATISHPLKTLLSALIHVSGEPSPTPPPNPNESQYSKNGFGEALKMIYSLASKTPENSSEVIDGTHITHSNSSGPVDLFAALDVIQHGLVIFDEHRNIIYANNRAPVTTNPDGSRSLKLLFNGSDNLDAWLDEAVDSAVRTEHAWLRIPDRVAGEEDQHIYDVLVSYEKGAKHETVVSLIDRTDQYHYDEDDLNFIAFAAHELRGPITVIRGYLDVLEQELSDQFKDDQEELFRRLVVSSNRLSGYINNILNTSRYDRRHLKVDLIEDTVANVYETIADDMSLRASSQHRLLSIQIPKDLPTIAADRASLSEVFGNLIDNAIKYSNEGGAINMFALAKGEYVEISVQDNGIGMPPNVVSNLFQKFYRSHRSRETVAGTGIGLYISKAIIESHGGTIGVRSTEGEGSIFTVSIPTYASVAEKLRSSKNSNEKLISHGSGWIKNHSLYRG